MDENKFENLIDGDLAKTHYIEGNYPNQFPVQMPIYLEIDLDVSPPTVSVDTYNFRLCGTPLDIWQKTRLVFELPPNVDASELRDWVDEELADELNTLIAGSEITWDNSNYVGRFNAESRAIIEQWESDNFKFRPPTHDGGIYDPVDYFSGSTRFPDSDNPTATIQANLKDYIITKDSTGEELNTIAEELTDEAEDEDVVFVGTVRGWLTDLREDCQLEADDD